MNLPQSACNIEAEQAILAGILCGANFEFAELSPEEFFFPLHRRLYSRLRLMDATDEPINVLAAIEPMGLDQVESAAVHALHSPMHGPFTPQNLASYKRIVKRDARHRKLLDACEHFLSANGEVPMRALEVQAMAQGYLEAAAPKSETALEIFDSAQEFKEAGPLSFSVEGFLQNDGCTMIGGLGGHGKTFLLLSVAKALFKGEGSRLWDLFPVVERADRIVYLIPECARTPFKHRLQVMGLYDYLFDGRLYVRTLSKGPAPSLSDPAILRAAKNAHVILDTATRFSEGEENNAGDNARGLAADIFALLSANARSVLAAHHSPKSFQKETVMSLEGVFRGSGDIGNMLTTGWGIKQLDAVQNIIHIENVKPRDFQPCDPFQIIGRPFIDQEGDFRLFKQPDECGRLEDEQRPNQANQSKHQERDERVTIVKSWLSADPNLTGPEMVSKFAALGITVNDATVRKYRIEARKT